MGCCLSFRNQRPDLDTSSSTIPHKVYSNPECAEQEQGREDTLGPKDGSQVVLSFPTSATHTDENENLVITSIQATDLALGLGRIPAGFYTTVHHSGHEWRTKSEPVLVNSDVVEWSGPIPIPSDPAASVSLVVYASFEFRPRLGNGEQLQELTTTVEQLLHHNAEALPFTFFPEGGRLTSPCSSLLVTVRRGNREGNDSVASKALEPHCFFADSQSQLEETTDQGHSALPRYRKHGGKRDLEHAIEQFQHALNICPLDHPCYAVAQANLAMAELIHCRVNDTDASVDVPVALYRNVLFSRPVGHPDRTRTLVQLASAHSARFERQRDVADVSEAKALLHETMVLISTRSHEYQGAVSALQSYHAHTMQPVQASEKPSIQKISTPGPANLDPWYPGLCLFTNFEQSGDLSILQQAITVLEASLRSHSFADRGYFAGLVLLGTALCHRFIRLGDLRDLEEAILRQRHAVHLSPNGHFGRPRFLTNLSKSLFTRFESLGELRDLLEAILRQQDAIQLTPDGHPLKPDRLNDLGNYVYARFLRLGKPSDLEEAISRQRNAVDLTPDGHPRKPSRLNSLGASLRTRFERLGQLSDLEEAISRQQDAIRLVPDSHRHRLVFLNSLGNSLLARFQSLGKLSDLQEAISNQRNALDLSPRNHRDKARLLTNLSNSLLIRFERLGELNDLGEAISRQQDAIHLIPDSHPRRVAILNSLGNTLLVRFWRLGELNDLEEAILRQRNAVDLIPDDHPDKPSCLSSLGTSLRTRFDRLGELNDLEEAVLRQRDAVHLIPDGDPQKPSRLNNLSISLFARFRRLGKQSDLEEAISSQRSAVDLTTDGHPAMPKRLNNLGTVFRTRFELLGELSDLEEAILRQRKAVDLVPEGHPDRLRFLSDFGNSLSIRFEHLGELDDLEDAISRHRDAVYLTPDGHPDKLTRLNNLGKSLVARFERLGELEDLEDAITRQRNTVDLTSVSDARRPTYLNNLSMSFRTRFKRLGELSDLEEVVSMQRDAVRLTPDGHYHKPSCLNNLGISLHARFESLGKLSDLEEAISTLGDAVDHTPDGHPDTHRHLNNHGLFFRTRFQHLGELSDLEETISRQLEAVRLIPNGHPDNPKHLNSLGTSFRIRFERLGVLSDLEEAISRQRDAVDQTPEGHPNKPGFLVTLGDSFVARFGRLGDRGDLERAVLSFSKAACAPAGPIAVRFSASRQWIIGARILCHHQTLFHAYSVAIRLLPQLAWIGLSLAHRYRELIRAADIVREAAAAALDLGRPETAVEWLEQGRSIVWGEMFQLRSSYDVLTSAYPDHARRLRELSAALEHASITHEKSLSLQAEEACVSGHRATESLQQEADRHRRLAIERDKLLQNIRKLPGFERFLLQKEFLQLRASAHSGPLVLLNAAETRCDALIVLADVDHVIHVPLPKFTLQRSMDLQTTLKSFVRRSYIIRDDRDGQPASQDCVAWESILASLWKCVVKPVLDALAFSIPGELSRIFWCPTGPFTFLPIHAAGFYDVHHSQPGHKVHDFVVSSYIPTLSILAPSPELRSTSSSNLRLLAVRQPPSDGQRKLRGAIAELEYIRAVVNNSPSAQITLAEPSIGTVEEIVSLMKEADWVHFACHGVQDTKNPTESGLCLADRRRLKLSDAISLSRPNRGLAFLSACQTAKGDEDLSDEAIHIAAGMLFAGYGGVIGSMWSISDKLAPNVARDVYEQLFRDSTRPDYREAAIALHVAVGRLRDDNIPFQEWLPFIHVGL